MEALASNELEAPTPTLSRESDPNYQQAQNRIEKLQAQLSATRASLGDTEQSLGQVRNMVKVMPRIEQRLGDLNHRQETTQALQADLFSKLKQAEIQLNLEKVSAESRYDFSPPGSNGLGRAPRCCSAAAWGFCSASSPRSWELLSRRRNACSPRRWQPKP